MRLSPLIPLALFVLLFTPAVFGNQVAPFAKGQIVEKVVCKAEPSFSYALYLPSSYDANRKHPIIYAFDPVARGGVPVERYRDAAEKYGYIVVGSHDSRNAPSPIGKIAQALWNDTHERFSIDDRRVYTTGFSGGARVASAIAQNMQGGVAGVIAHGAGFHQNIEPSKSLPFIAFFAIGNEDFNMPEVRGLARKLEELGVAHRAAVFDGDHTWAPAEVCVEAVEWMEVQAMKTGRAAKSDALLDKLLEKRLEKARAYEAAQNACAAYLAYSAIAEDFTGLRDVSQIEKQAARLRETKAVKEQLRLERDEDLKQLKQVNEFLALKAKLKEPEERAVTLSEIRGLIGSLKRKADEKTPSSDRLVARRTLGTLFAESFETAQARLYNKDYTEAAGHLELAAIIRPANPGIFYSLARAYALGGDKRKAVEALKKAVERGFTNAAALDNEAFDGLRDNAVFKKLVEDLKKKS